MTENRSAGFTLLEVLVALIVLGFLVVGLTQGTRFGIRAWNTQARMVGERSELDAVDRTLRRLVEQMDAGTASGGATLTGNMARMAFTSELPMATTLATRRADMVLMVDAHHRLVLRWIPHLHAIRFGPPPAAQDAALLSDVARLEIGYWRKDGGSWLNGWAELGLPALIRIRIVFGPNDPRHWPDIVAAPMTGRDGG